MGLRNEARNQWSFPLEQCRIDGEIPLWCDPENSTLKQHGRGYIITEMLHGVNVFLQLLQFPNAQTCEHESRLVGLNPGSTPGLPGKHFSIGAWVLTEKMLTHRPMIF